MARTAAGTEKRTTGDRHRIRDPRQPAARDPQREPGSGRPPREPPARRREDWFDRTFDHVRTFIDEMFR